MEKYFVAPAERTPHNLFDDHDFARQRAFFAARPDLSPTPLRSLPGLAQRLGIGELLVKDETNRFGLNAFKAAGAIFAIETLRARGEIRAGDMLVCASEGNHGRAVARAARTAECQAHIYMSESAAPARISAIESEGATVTRVAGSYDDAVRMMAADAATNGWTIISDTSLPGYEEIPRLIMLGYTRLLDEAELGWVPAPPPDAIFVPGGVGGLLASVACWADWRCRQSRSQIKRPLIVGVEPTAAACLQASARCGRPQTLEGPFDTVMAGLRCGEVSQLAFRAVLSLVDAYVAIDDACALEAIASLAAPVEADPAIKAGASGAAALGGLQVTMADPAAADLKRRLTLESDSRILVIVSEGVTDPAIFEAALARVASRTWTLPFAGNGRA